MADRLEDLMDTKAVAALFKVDSKTIRRWRQTGSLPPPLKIGNKPFWLRSDLEDFLAVLKAKRLVDNQGQTRTFADKRGQTDPKADKRGHGPE